MVQKFRDYLPVDYKPGSPGLIKKNAKKRKRRDTEHESVQHVDEAARPKLQPHEVRSHLNQHEYRTDNAGGGVTGSRGTYVKSHNVKGDDHRYGITVDMKDTGKFTATHSVSRGYWTGNFYNPPRHSEVDSKQFRSVKRATDWLNKKYKANQKIADTHRKAQHKAEMDRRKREGLGEEAIQEPSYLATFNQARKKTTAKQTKDSFPNAELNTPDQVTKVTKNPPEGWKGEHKPESKTKTPAEADKCISNPQSDNFGKSRPDRLGEQVVDEALSMAQRLAKKRQMKRYKSKIKVGRDRAKRKMADSSRLETRARRAARKQIYKKLTKGMDKSELTYQRRQEIEKRLDKMKPKIDRLAKRMLPKVRKAEVDRRRGQSTSKE